MTQYIICYFILSITLLVSINLYYFIFGGQSFEVYRADFKREKVRHIKRLIKFILFMPFAVIVWGLHEFFNWLFS